MNILICDSNALSVTELTWFLIDHGHSVCEPATTLGECLERCSAQRPELVLVGMNSMEGDAGLSLVEALTGQGIPSIIVSGDADRVPASSSAAAVEFKPVHEVRLAQAIGQLARRE